MSMAHVVQTPSCGQFSAADLEWSTNHIAYIPESSLQNFVDGEGRSRPSVETTFYIRTSKNCDDEKCIWSKYIIFCCAYGPHEIPDCEPKTPPAKGTFPKEKEGSRPKAIKADFNNHLKRGCQCHFIAKIRKNNPYVVEIKYKHREHINKDGRQCHGTPMNNQVLRTWGPRCITAPRLTHAVVKDCEDLLRAGWSVLHVFDFHIKNQFEREGLDRGPSAMDILLTEDGRDDLLSKKDLYNMKCRVDKETYQWDGDDQTSVLKWVSLYPERVLLHRQYKKGPPEQPFLLGLQSQWQLMQMIKLSHGSVLALDSTFATNKYGFPFFTLVCFDKHDMGLPAAWCIQQTESAEEIATFLQTVKKRACAVKSDWKPSCFIIDCSAAEVSAIQIVFPGVPIYFCTWHVRRAWKENLIKHVSDRGKLLDMSDELGDLMYAPNDDELFRLWGNFQEKYVTESSFLKYFQTTWMNRPDKWMRALRTMRRCNQDTNGACEAWHGTLKRMLLRKIGWLNSRRLDRLIYEMFATILPFFWYQIRCKELGRKVNYKKEEIVINSLLKAEHHILDSQISFPNPNRPNQALFTSRKPNKAGHVIHNIYSNLPTCNCKWADQGNMCKHQLKALLVKGHSGGVLVEHLGTNFGSQFDSLRDLEHSTEAMGSGQTVSLPKDADVTMEGPTSGIDLDILVAHPRDVEGQKPEMMTIPALKRLHEDILMHIGDDVELTQVSFMSAQLCLNKLRELAYSKTITGKERTTPIDTFVRPVHLTTKRRLGVVDVYHGARRRKRVQPVKPKQCKQQWTQTREGTTPQGISKEPVDEEVEIDKYPPNSEIRRESLRQHLARLGQDYREGKKSRKTKKTKLVNPPPRSKNFGQLRTEGSGHASTVIDLNVISGECEEPFDLNVTIEEVEGVYVTNHCPPC